AQWQREQLLSSAMQTHLDFWQQQLHTPLPQLDLPTDHPRPPVQTFAGAELAFSLPQTLRNNLLTLSHQEGVTLFMTLVAAFNVLLCHYTGQTDILLGTPIIGRNRAELEGMIGCCINTLALRTDLAGQPSFRALLKRVQQMTLDAYTHQ